MRADLFSVPPLKFLAALAAASVLLLPGIAMAQQKSFKNEQMKYPRVKAAFSQKEAAVKNLFAAKNMEYPPAAIFFRAFKKEKNHDHGVVELWARGENTEKFKLIKTYPVCNASGGAGPKRREGDGQVPEGFYRIESFNPASAYHLSMRISYPNTSDRILGAKGAPGSDIYIHGNCVSIGCLAMTDEFIKEIYVIAVDAKNNSGLPIHFHIFPQRMDREGMRELAAASENNPALSRFWNNIEEGYRYFEENRVPPAVTVDAAGKYLFR